MIRWGVLGAAAIAKQQVMPAIKKDSKSKLLAIASLSGKAQQLAKDFDIEKVYDSYEALLKDPEIDAVYIPLPNSLHKPWAIKAAEAGKHILCEKPAALTADEMTDIANACDKNGVTFMEAFMYRFHPQHKRVKEIIAAGEIGDVRLFRASFSFFLGERREDIRMIKELGGGSLYDIGCYCINSLRTILEDEPQQVFASGKIDPQSQVDTVLTANLKLNQNIFAQFDCSFEIPDRQQYEVVGTKGIIRVSRAYRPDLFDGEGLIQVIGKHGRSREEKVYGDQYLLQIQHFTNCLRNGEQPSYSTDQSLRNMRVIDACYQSLRESGAVFINETKQ